jgi:PPK2 family polyphosphate:nucleotide phosphotransferase
MSDRDDTTGIEGVAGLLGLKPGPVTLADHDPHGKPGFDGGKREGKKAAAAMDDELLDLQTRLAADGYTDGHDAMLVVIQGMDTSGKGGVLKHAVSMLDPGGVRVASFKKPTEEELEHDFLWRVEKQAPHPGQVTIFDRSHYEDVLIARVHELAPKDEIEHRYDAINEFDKKLVDGGTRIVKLMLHISKEEQRARLLKRLNRPDKLWKFKPEDVDERQRWDEYQTAYEIALERCNTEWAPWYVVPSDRKWYRTLAVASLLRDTLASFDLDWPKPDYDVEEQKARLGA